MQAMILAAGRGLRMRPLTDQLPKPLLEVAGRSLIEWRIQALAQAGLIDIVINHAWLGRQIEAALGDGQRWGVRLQYSAEPLALETAGGIAQALPFFKGQPFLVMNGDIWTDWDPARALQVANSMPLETLAHLVMVPNPTHHPEGDFILQPDGRLSLNPGPAPARTYAGLGVFRPELFALLEPGQPAPLAPLLRQGIDAGRISGELHPGRWVDVGTPERLAWLDAHLQAHGPGPVSTRITQGTRQKAPGSGTKDTGTPKQDAEPHPNRLS
ncbi:N-acetylmuramate alpha-1-phosphate uridylyltransferase MurU [Castellaniella sp.]|uniref:N-acetylmuramate alpha-1-phosphate uridylyltransferase MurU n=1 Tax=Castellaniella sp. TaxID=1955812 RepID=UPI00355D21DE